MANETENQNPTPAPVQTVTAADLAAPLAERMPDVTAETETAALAPSVPRASFDSPPPDTAPKDSRGVRFNPEKHAANEDGTPRKNKHGNFYPKGLGKHGAAKIRANTSPAPSEEMPAPTFNAPGSAPRPADPNLSAFDEYDAAAEIYLLSAYGPLIVAFSEHVRPDATEHAALKTAVANYLRVKQISEPSPGWSLFFVATAVAVKKSAIPEVRERAAAIGAKLGIIKPEPQKKEETK